MKPVSTDLILTELILAYIDEVIHLRAENARLREMLKPFIATVDWQAIQTAKDGDWFWFLCTAGDLRAARAAVGETE